VRYGLRLTQPTSNDIFSINQIAWVIFHLKLDIKLCIKIKINNAKLLNKEAPRVMRTGIFID
jgi:hypothetical protein